MRVLDDRLGVAPAHGLVELLDERDQRGGVGRGEGGERGRGRLGCGRGGDVRGEGVRGTGEEGEETEHGQRSSKR